MSRRVFMSGIVSDSAATRSAARAESKSSGNSVRIVELEEQLETMAIKCQAMWELLCHAGQLTDEHLMQKIQEIDLRDGMADGKMTAHVGQCPKCNRKTSARRQNCLYCGEPLKVGEMFSPNTKAKAPRRQEP